LGCRPLALMLALMLAPLLGLLGQPAAVDTSMHAHWPMHSLQDACCTYTMLCFVSLWPGIVPCNCPPLHPSPPAPRRLPSPDTFAALTRLTMLSVDAIAEERDIPEHTSTMESTLEVLPQLQHFRCSYASSGGMEVPHLPRSLTRLHGLQRFWWDISTEDPSLPDPQGTWVQGLRSLALLSSDILTNQDHLLAATPHLESLTVLCTSCTCSYPDPYPEPALWVAVKHTAVRHVHVCMPDAHRSADSAIAWARRQRPDVLFTSSNTPPFKCGAAFDGEDE